MKRFTNVVLMAIVAVIFVTFNVNAAGLGQSFMADGGVTVTVTKNPHKNFSGDWGIVDPSTGVDVVIGQTTEIDVDRYVGSYDNQELLFWADGKNKRFYTGHGNAQTTDNQFVINGVHFNIAVVKIEIPKDDDSTPVVEVEEAVVRTFEVTSEVYSETDCSDPDVNYVPVKFSKFQALYSSILGFDVFRMICSGQGIDWTLFHTGEVTVEVTFNNSCDDTYNLTDAIEYFDLVAEKDFEGHRLTNYDYPDVGVYPAKIRITKERGIDKHYLYINKVNLHHMKGQTVNCKIRLFQDGELIQAYEGDSVMESIYK